jgi:hypothetical protein
VNEVLVTFQFLLAATFLTTGSVKITQSKEQLVDKLYWVDYFSPGVLKFIGVIELLGALGLALPTAFGVATVFTPITAIGVALMMISATAVHARLRDHIQMGVTSTLFAVAVLIAWARFGPYSV